MTGGRAPEPSGSVGEGLCRRRFLGDSLRGATIIGLAASLTGGAHAFPARNDVPGVRVHPASGVFNGQDLPVAAYLETIVAPEHPDHGALIRSGAGLAESLAWALAPSGAAETWHLDELARRAGFDLASREDTAIRRDRDDADRRVREALRVLLPGTEFFRLYLDQLLRGARTTLGGSVASRLASLTAANVLGARDVDFLLGPEGPERALLPIQPLEEVRRLTYHRYLLVHDLLCPDAYGESPDLVVSALAPHVMDAGSAAAPTSLADQLTVVERIMQLSAGRWHALFPFHVSSTVEAGEALAAAREAVERRGFVGVSLACTERPARELPVHHELLAWCESDDIPIVAPGARVNIRGGPDDRAALSVRELKKGRGARERLERFYERHGMASPRWLGVVDEVTVSSPA